MRKSPRPDAVRRGPDTALTAISVAAAMVAAAAAFIAVRAIPRGGVARARLAEKPTAVGGLAVSVLDGSVVRELPADLRRYAFTVAITNQSDVDRMVTAAALRVRYRTRANFLGAVDLPLSAGGDPSELHVSLSAGAGGSALHLPLRIAPGETVTRTARLDTSNVIPRHCRVDGYTLLLADAAGDRWSCDASLPQVLRDDHDGDGPATWGWD
jgi:hypothetical protein